MYPPLTQQSSRSPRRYKVAGFETGSERSRIACTSVKIAVLAPMPRETVRITVAANPGDLASWRMASRKSVISAMMDGPGLKREAGDGFDFGRCGRRRRFQSFNVWRFQRLLWSLAGPRCPRSDARPPA